MRARSLKHEFMTFNHDYQYLNRIQIMALGQKFSLIRRH